MSDPNDANDSKVTNKGNIVFRVDPNYSTDGSKITGDRRFQVLYYSENGVINSANTKNFILK